MTKWPMKLAWFDRLGTCGLRSHYAWLSQLRPTVDKIANFGCISSEPFALLWTLDATEVKVVEIDESNLNQECGPILDHEILTKTLPESLEGRSVEFIVADMSSAVTALQSGYFDLAYCERVLYNMTPDFDTIQRAIGAMARVVKPGGKVIAADESITSGPAYERGEPIDISSLFERVGLVKIKLESIPPNTYCYEKPPNSDEARVEMAG